MHRIALIAALLGSGSCLAQGPDAGGLTVKMGGPAIAIQSTGTPRQIIKRPEVQTHLHLSVRQRALLDEATGASGGTAISINLNNTGPAPANEAEIGKQIGEQIQKQLEAQDAVLRKILTEAQWQRLSQLWLQWRGPMALDDASVARQAGLEDAQRTAVSRAVAAYQRIRSEVFAAMSQQDHQSNPDGSAVRVMVRMDMSELDKPLSPACKRLTAARKEAEAAILAALTPSQRSAWSGMQGDPFIFKAEKQALRF